MGGEVPVTLAIGEFSFLRRLILFHGHESYRRNAVLVNYNFYKNALLVLPPFLCGQMASFSGQPFYEQLMYQMYNSVFTALPIMVYALLDCPEDAEALEVCPEIYEPGL